MELSVVIVNFNTKKLLFNCLESIPLSEEREVIVVDNGSDDGSIEALKPLAENQKIELILNQTNRGFAKANNQGIKLAKGKYILLLNSDTMVKKGTLKKMISFLENNSGAGAVAPRLLNKDGSIQASCYQFPSFSGAIKEFFLNQPGAFSKFFPQGNSPSAVKAVVGAALMIPRKVIEKVGLLDERFFIYFEDIEYCHRLWKAGYRVYYLPKAEIVHLHGATGKKMGQKPNAWLIESSKKYHGTIRHYLLNSVIYLGQKWQKLKKLFA